MKKIPCLFMRDFSDKRRPVLLRDVTPGCEWVLVGDGIPTRKRDGTACAVIGGALFKRYDVKRGKSVPTGAVPCDDPDPVTGHWPHWILVGEEPESRWHREAWNFVGRTMPDGTYELVGPKLQGNPEGYEQHVFIRHGVEVVDGCPRDWEALRAFLSAYSGEGIVFHHPNGAMTKIRRDDFGFDWPIKKAGA
jgi:hypothetical protein